MAENGSLEFEAKMKVNTDGVASSLDEMVQKAKAVGLNIDRYATLGNVRKQIKQVLTDIEQWNTKQKEIGRQHEKTAQAISKTEKNLKQLKEALAYAQTKGDAMDVRVYTYKINEAEKSLSGLNEKMRELEESSDEIGDKLSPLNQQFSALKGIEQQLDQTQTSLLQKIRKNREELSRMAAAGQQGTEAYKKLAVETINLSKQQKITNATLAAGSKSGLAMAATTQGLSALVGAYSAGLGALSTFTGETEDQYGIQTKLQSAIAMTTGVQNTYQALLKSSSTMQGIFAVQTKAAEVAVKLKAAAENKGAVASKAATIAQKAFNLVAKANPYVLLAMALVTVVGALTAFAFGTAKAKKEQEAFNKSLEKQEAAISRLQTEQKNNLTIMEAEGATQAELLQQRQEDAKEIEKQTAAIVEQIEARRENGKLSEEDTELLVEWRKKNQDAWNTMMELSTESVAAEIKLNRERNEEIKKLTETANKEQLALLKSRTKDKMKLIDMELQQTIAAINKEKAAYQEKYGKNADTSQFSRRIDIAKQGAADQKSEVSRERGRQYEDLTADADKFAQNQEIAALKEKADATQDMNEKLLLQAEIRQRMLNIELDELEIERQRALEDAGDDEVQKDIVNQTYDQKEQQVKATSSATAIKEEADTLQQRKKQYEDFAQRVTEIEEQRVANLKKIDEGLESGNISEETAAQQREFVNTQAEQDTEQASLDSFGTDVEGLGAELTGILQSVMDQGIMEVQAQLPTLKAELAKLQSNKNADPTQLAKAFAKVSAAEKKVNDYTEGLGDTTKDYGKESKAQCKKAAAAMSLVGEAVDIVAENFGEYMGEAGQDAMSVIQTVVSASTTALTAISTTSITAAEGVKTAEKASVILAIISAAIQVTMALVNVFAKYFSEAAQLQEQIDENNERIETSKNRIKDLKHEQNDKTGADYWKNQWEQIAEYNNQMLLAEKNQELYKQKQAASHTDKKEEDAKDAAQEAHESAMEAEETMQDLLDEFYEEMSGTNLKSFSENLADSLVEGMREGTEDMSDIWDSALDDMFSDMLKNQINMQLQKNLAGVFEKVQAAFSGGDTELTDAEINAIKAEYESEKERSQSMLDYYQSLMDELGLTTSDDIEASSGGFESMSQDTADELNGRFTSLQMSGASIDAKMQMQVDGTNSLITQAQGIKDSVTLMVQIATNSLEELRQINTNTALLSETNQRLKQIQMNTEKL